MRATNRARSSRSPIPKITLTLFGAENVRSNPATRTALDAAPQRQRVLRVKPGEDPAKCVALYLA